MTFARATCYVFGLAGFLVLLGTLLLIVALVS